MDINFWEYSRHPGFCAAMLAQGEEGHVVNVASMSGVLSSPAQSAYNASKHAVFTVSEGLYYELKERAQKSEFQLPRPAGRAPTSTIWTATARRS